MTKKQSINGTSRRRPLNVKEDIVVARQYRNIKLQCEHVAEFAYRPTKCNRSYRVIVLRKTLAIKQGQLSLWDEVRYFITSPILRI